MDLQTALLLICNSSGRIITVEFVKRSTGELRQMTCRTGVRKYLKGGEAAYDPARAGLIWVYDMVAKGYRSINVSGLTRIKVNGEWVDIQQPQVSK